MINIPPTNTAPCPVRLWMEKLGQRQPGKSARPPDIRAPNAYPFPMFLSRLKSRHKNAAGALIFILLTPIFFRLLYGVPPLPSDYVINFAPTTLQLTAKNAPKTIIHKDELSSHSQSTQNPLSTKSTLNIPNSISIASNLGSKESNSESTDKKRLAPFKTFKNKIIKDKSFNPAEILKLRTIKFNSEITQLTAPSQGRRFLTTNSNAPPLRA